MIWAPEQAEACSGVLRAGKVSMEEILEACFRKLTSMRTRSRPSGNAARCGHVQSTAYTQGKKRLDLPLGKGCKLMLEAKAKWR